MTEVVSEVTEAEIPTKAEEEITVESEMLPKAEEPSAVSYTHLDVYKRQVMYSPLS